MVTTWSYLTLEDVLGLAVSILMVLMISGLAVWFACSLVESNAKIGQRIRRSDYDALLRENERLKDSLADAKEENSYLRRLYRTLPPRAEDGRRNAA